MKSLILMSVFLSNFTTGKLGDQYEPMQAITTRLACIEYVSKHASQLPEAWKNLSGETREAILMSLRSTGVKQLDVSYADYSFRCFVTIETDAMVSQLEDVFYGQLLYMKCVDGFGPSGIRDGIGYCENTAGTPQFKLSEQEVKKLTSTTQWVTVSLGFEAVTATQDDHT
ncbi:hypothetical protein MRB53_042318 [Persea americana]|nr:hypothetical protein MRB53_042318 [Persea americana]